MHYLFRSYSNFYWRGGFCLFVELHGEGSAPCFFCYKKKLSLLFLFLFASLLADFIFCWIRNPAINCFVCWCFLQPSVSQYIWEQNNENRKCWTALKVGGKDRYINILLQNQLCTRGSRESQTPVEILVYSEWLIIQKTK